MYTSLNLILTFYLANSFGYFNEVICQKSFSICSATPCKNGGICNQLIFGGYSCICKSGFVGTNCEISMNNNFCSKQKKISLFLWCAWYRTLNIHLSEFQIGNFLGLRKSTEIRQYFHGFFTLKNLWQKS